MTAQDLKNGILQLAVQGKLVKQRPDEGTAEELYLQIQKEKQALILAGKIKKEKPLSEITEDEKPFDIPENWKWVRLDDLAIKEIKRGKSPTYSAGSGTRVFAQKCNTKLGHIKLDLALYLDESTLSKYPESEFMRDKDIVINSTGDGTLGRVGIFRDKDNPDGFPVVPDSHVTIIRTNSELVDYVFYGLKYYQPYMEKLGSGSTKQTELSAGIIKNLLFPLPPLAEQQRIVAKIEELMPLVDEYGKAEERLTALNAEFPDKLRKSILQQAIQGKLTARDPTDEPASELLKRIRAEKERLIKEGKIKKEKPFPPITEEEVLFEIPDTWAWVRFYDTVDIASNLVDPGKYQDYMHIAPDNIEKGTGVLLPCRTVKEDAVASPNHLFYTGQLIYSKIRPLLRKAVIAPFDGLCSADMYPINTWINPRYLQMIMLSDFFNKQVAGIISNRVKMPKINQNELGLTVFPLPPLAEQQRIVDRVNELLTACDELK